MKISEILQALEIPSNEIKTRFKNKQIKLDGEDVSNIELDINENFIMEFGDFVFEFFTIHQLLEFKMLKLLDVEVNEILKHHLFYDLNDFNCLTIAKNTHYIIMKNIMNI